MIYSNNLSHSDPLPKREDSILQKLCGHVSELQEIKMVEFSKN
jgi:hypothetical protein